MSTTRLSATSLQRPCGPEEIPFATTADASALDGVIGQDRALDALEFGVGIRHHGYNLFAVGPVGVGKQTLLRQVLDARAAHEPVPSDWCYLHNFDDPERPRVLELPPGMGVRLQRDMDRAIEALRVALRATFDSDEYRTRKQQIVDALKARQEQALEQVRLHAQRRDVAVLKTETGIAIAPLRDGQPMDPDKFHELPEAEQKLLTESMERVGAELQALFEEFHEWGHEHHEELKALDRELTTAAAHGVLNEVRDAYHEFPAVLQHIDRVEVDVVEHAPELLAPSGGSLDVAIGRALERDPAQGPAPRRYRVNVLVDRSELTGAPVVYEDNPTYANLIGRIEHETQFGALITNFTLIRAGALHRASGGYLILDAVDVLRHPYAWEALKRVLRSGEIKVESLGRAIGLVPTVSLEPESIPFGRTKIVLTGERVLYYLLAELDPDFPALFKVLVDFEETMDRRPDTERTYANLVARLVAKEDLKAFDRGAVARVIDRAARLAGDAEKLSVHMRGIVDLLRESDYWAGQGGHTVVAAEDVQRAIDAQRTRSGRIQRRLEEAIDRGDILIATDGEAVGQVNGLAVARLGEHSFGHPSRITARVRLGDGGVVDIEREVELGGPIHAKGVMILGGLLGARYAPSVPLSLSASLVFEQSYGGIDGDSASVAELCALLSALADAPVRQSIAVTGSVNQYGRVQSIGGVNEKIEGFFDVCKARGLTGDQGVIIPASNVKNLMLRRDVVDAVEAGRFAVYAVEDVDDAIEILTGTPAGSRDDTGVFADGSINARVEARLIEFAERAKSFASVPPS